MRTWAIVPLKSLDLAKTRLTSVLSRPECREIALHMAEDVVGALTGAACFSDVGILTADPALGSLAERFGCRALGEEPTGDWQQSLALAGCDLADAGTQCLVVVPGDLPTLRPADIAALLARHQSDVTVVPAARDGGTNALVLSPPDAMGFLFGPDSARRHVDAALRAGHRAESVALEAFAHDIDTPDDLRRFCESATGGATRKYLDRSGIAARLRERLAVSG